MGIKLVSTRMGTKIAILTKTISHSICVTFIVEWVELTHEPPKVKRIQISSIECVRKVK